MNYKDYLTNLISGLGIEKELIEISVPPKEGMGDYCLPCFKIKVDNLNNPNEKANYILEHLTFDNNIIIDAFVVGPYLNFNINKESLGKIVLEKIENLSDKYGSTNEGIGKSLLIEHTSINPNASPHIGRSRNSIIGDFLVHLYKFNGYEIDREYFVNDIGKQIAMLLIAVKKYSDINRVTFDEMLSLYIKINDEAKEDENIEKEVFKYLNELENGNDIVRNEFKSITDICVEGQKKIFDKMDIHWDTFTHESDFVFGHITKTILDKIAEKGRLKEDENGRLYVDLTGYNIPTKTPVLILTREDKTSLYPLRDIAYTIYKMNKNKDVNLIVLGEDQKVYMEQISAVMDILGYGSPKLISYSFVLLNGDKMATREGKVVLLEDFINATIDKLKNSFSERGTELTNDEYLSLASSCIKYNMLNINRGKNINFNLDDATNFTGNSAIYILYNYVRIKSILNKCDLNKKYDNIILKTKTEEQIIKKLYDFEDTVKETVKTNESVIITKYLNDLCGLFSKYYEETSILKEENSDLKNSRLLLLDSVRIVIENGTNILGIKTVEKL
ncbi:arginine--tRNA ligase [Clostridium sp. CAG:628]|nr:arginine--tRNA ligase [Clostridium sp. CAG:628]